MMDSRIKVKQLFYIKRTKLRKNGEAPVYLKLSINSQSVEIAIGVTIAPELWSADKGGAKGATNEAKNANSFIEKTSYQINNIISDLKSENMEVTAHSVRNVFLGKTIGNITLISAFEDHNKKIRLLLGKDYAPSTVTEFDSCLRIVKQYLQSRFGKPDVYFDKVDHEFLCGFELFLKSVRNCEHNTTMKLIKMLKKIIRIALVNNWIKKDPFSSYKISFRKVDRGFLTEAELDLIINTEFEYQYHQYAKDVFLFACFTGLAYSDLKALNRSNIFQSDNGKCWVMINRKKTDSACHVPLLPIPLSILQKYENHPLCIQRNTLLPVPANQNLNNFLKEIAKKCGITKKVTTHLARHTFATTVTLNNDIPIESVSKMLGHSSINMTKIYARLLDKKISSDMEKLYEKFKA